MRIASPTLLAVLAVSLVSFPTQAFACSCMYYEDEDKRMQTFYEHADLVLQGIPLEMKEKGNSHAYTVSVEKVWKGQADAYIDIVTADNSAACGIEMSLNNRVIIYATKTNGKYETGLCSGTVAVAQSGNMTAWLNEEKQSLPEVPTPPLDIGCEPYICKNGEEHPSCTEDGHQINYLINPCQLSDAKYEEENAQEKQYNFTDVPDDHPNAKAINFIHDEGIVQGYDDGTYGAQKLIDRAEFSKIIVGSTFSAEEIDDCESNDLFSDVSQSDWFADYICVAKAYKILEGYDDGTFGPGKFINFAEASKIVVTAFGIETRPDDHLGVWWRPYVFALARIGGLPSTFSDPNQQLTRADMAEIIYRVMMGMEK